MQLRNHDGIVWRDGDAMGPAGMGGAHPWSGGIQRISGDTETRGKWRNGVAGPGTLTFSAFFAASASERLSKLTKPTGCGESTGGISQAGGEQRGEPLTPGNGGTREQWDGRPIWSSSYLLGCEFDERPFVPLRGKDKKGCLVEIPTIK